MPCSSAGNLPVAGNPEIPAMRPHNGSRMAPVTLNNSGEGWMPVNMNKTKQKKKNSEPGWAQRSQHEVEIPKEKGRESKNNKVTALAGSGNGNNSGHNRSSMGRLSLESAMGITLNTTSTHPWESSHLRVPWGNTNTLSAHPWASSRLRVPWGNTNTPSAHPWVGSRLRVP